MHLRQVFLKTFVYGSCCSIWQSTDRFGQARCRRPRLKRRRRQCCRIDTQATPHHDANNTYKHHCEAVPLPPNNGPHIDTQGRHNKPQEESVGSMNQQVERSASQEQSVSSMNQQIERSASLPSMKSMASMTIVPNPGHKGASAKHGTHPAPLLLDRIPSLSGDPFDAFDDFADLHSRHHAQMTPLMSPVTPASSQPFCATPSSTTISSVDTWTVRQQSINASPCTSINASPCTPVESLHAHIQTLRSLSSARRMARALKNLHDMRRDIPGAALVSTDLIPSVCNALSAFVSSSAVCEQACRFLSEIAQRGPKARRIALGYSALQLANDAISNHFGLYPSTVQWALHAIGSLCANGSSMITHTLLSNRTFHWILVSMRQWRDVPLIQTYAFRALSTAIQTDFENAFHLVLSHAFFHELNEALENFAHDPFLVADAFEILLLFICPSAEFRRLSFCEGVLEAVVEAFLPHAAVCRVAAAFARIVSVFCVDACSRVVVVRSGAVHALLCALEHVRVPGPRHSIPKVVPHRIGRLSAPSPRVGITDADCCEDECRSLSMPDAWARSPTSTTDVMVSVLQALLATCVGCTQGCELNPASSLDICYCEGHLLARGSCQCDAIYIGNICTFKKIRCGG